MIIRLHKAVSAVCPIVGVNADGTFDPATTATAEQIAAAQSVVASFDWSGEAQAVWEKQQNRMGAAALMASPDAMPRAVRAAVEVAAILRNNVAEALGVLIDHVDELAAMPKASRRGAIIDWIAADRAAWVQAGGAWAEPPPEPTEVYDTGTDRVQRNELVPLVGAAIFGE